MVPDQADIHFKVQSGIGWVLLNRPQALNALSFEMIKDFAHHLRIWRADQAVAAVVVRSLDPRSFCAGGDVKAAAFDSRALLEGRSDGSLARTYFRNEYLLNIAIKEFPKPYVAVIDGIVMGGGAGISVHGSHRIVGDGTLFSMPEAAIGFFPDVGAGYFLSRCPGRLGWYLALTAARIGAGDCLYAGLATHYVPSEKHLDLIAALEQQGWQESVIDEFSQAAPASLLSERRVIIDKCFSQASVEKIVDQLKQSDDPITNEISDALRKLCPVSLKVAHRLLEYGQDKDMHDVMSMEYRLSQSFMRLPCFYEGIRAALIDKDKAPHWDPATLEQVTSSDLDRYFAGTGDELFALGEEVV